MYVVKAGLERLEKLSGPVLYKKCTNLVQLARDANTNEEKERRVHEGIKDQLAKVGLDLTPGVVVKWVPDLHEQDNDSVNVGIIFREVYGEKCWSKMKKYWDMMHNGENKDLIREKPLTEKEVAEIEEELLNLETLDKIKEGDISSKSGKKKHRRKKGKKERSIEEEQEMTEELCAMERKEKVEEIEDRSCDILLDELKEENTHLKKKLEESREIESRLKEDISVLKSKHNEKIAMLMEQMEMMRAELDTQKENRNKDKRSRESEEKLWKERDKMMMDIKQKEVDIESMQGQLLKAKQSEQEAREEVDLLERTRRMEVEAMRERHRNQLRQCMKNLSHWKWIEKNVCMQKPPLETDNVEHF